MTEESNIEELEKVIEIDLEAVRESFKEMDKARLRRRHLTMKSFDCKTDTRVARNYKSGGVRETTLLGDDRKQVSVDSEAGNYDLPEYHSKDLERCAEMLR